MDHDDDTFHVPQQSRRHKLRFLSSDDHHLRHPDLLSPLQLLHDHHPHHLLLPSPSSTTSAALNLSLSTHARTLAAFNATPVGPFTGYASILSRSRFLRPAQDLLEGFSVANAAGDVGGSGGVLPSSTSTMTATKNILEDSRSLFSDEDEDVSRRCTNPNLVSMLHEVYKRYKLYCQQMQSAVTSFESVAGLANAAPFISFAVRAMFRHFHCLKNAILDQIRVSSKGFSGVDCRRDHDSGSCSEDKVPYDEKQPQGPSFLQHPVWRSQRGFPDKAVAVLRTWLFEHFLHPYPSDSDKQMLAQKTGLSRSQVSNWFTNARVRLWKPMVEEMHALERKTQSSKAVDTSKFINLSADTHSSLPPQLTEKDFEIMNQNRHRDHESQSKRSRIEAIPRAEQSKEQFGLPCNQMISSIGGNQIGQLSHSPPLLASNQQNTTGLPWSAQGQIIPFWLARQ